MISRQNTGRQFRSEIYRVETITLTGNGLELVIFGIGLGGMWQSLVASVRNAESAQCSD